MQLFFLTAKERIEPLLTTRVEMIFVPLALPGIYISAIASLAPPRRMTQMNGSMVEFHGRHFLRAQCHGELCALAGTNDHKLHLVTTLERAHQDDQILGVD